MPFKKQKPIELPPAEFSNAIDWAMRKQIQVRGNWQKSAEWAFFVAGYNAALEDMVGGVKSLKNKLYKGKE
jgi:hypothetical protein